MLERSAFALTPAAFRLAAAYTAAIATAAHDMRPWHLLQLHRQPVRL